MSSLPCTLLVDNGSHRATSTLNLRRLAAELTQEVDHHIHPVSLLHSTKADPADLGGIPAEIFEPFLKKQRKEHGTNSFLVVPLFFGHSAAIYEYIPQRVKELQRNWPELEVRLAPCLVNLDEPEDRGVAEALATLVSKKAQEEGIANPAVALVDHGTPRIAVNLVRNFLGGQLKEILKEKASVVEACSMERREGEEYAFNEPLLENLLGQKGFQDQVILSMLFLSAGRHAGPGGDIAEICEECEKEHPGLKTHMSDLFATHHLITEVLAKRFHQGVSSDPVSKEVPPPQAVLAQQSSNS